MNWKVPFFDLRLGEAERRAVDEVLESGWLTMGHKVEAFEQAFAERLGAPGVEAVAVTNGTAALHLALVALGIGPGDEVICPSLTFVADANVVRHVGATPVFADIGSETDWNISPGDIEKKITERTAAILVVHYAGYPCQMDAIVEIAEARRLKIVEDACHAPLAEWQGRKLGTIGDVGCFSFFGNKNMTTGEGGMAVTGDPELASRLRLLRTHGMTTTTLDRSKGHAFEYDAVFTGFNYRLDEMRAAMGIVQLGRLDAAHERRSLLVNHYRDAVAEHLQGVVVPFADITGRCGFHLFPILLPDGFAGRAGAMERLRDDGIQTSIHYRPIHHFSAYKDVVAEVPVTDRIAGRILTLPLFAAMETAQIDYVVDRLGAALST